MMRPVPVILLFLCPALASLPLPAGAEESPGEATREVALSLDTHGPSLAVGISDAGGISVFEFTLRFTPGGFLAVPRPASPSPAFQGLRIDTDTARLVISGSAERPLPRTGITRLATVPIEVRKPLAGPIRVEILECGFLDSALEPIPANAGRGINIHPSQVNYRFGESQIVEHFNPSRNGAHPLRVMSFNIRYDNPGDGANAWPHRKNIAASMIRFHRADSAGLQEAQRHQVDDLTECLPEYAWFGVGRDDGEDAGEFMAIFYRKDRLELLDEDTFWLSENPEVPGSRSWDAAIQRIATWGKLRDRETGRAFFHFNTHFDHAGEEARRMSAKLLLRKIDEIAGQSPVIVTGDFNCLETSRPYEILTTGDGRPESALADAMKFSLHGHHGPGGTLSRFEIPGSDGHRIDFIFVRGGVRILQHGILADSFDGRFPSDHLPVLAEFAVH